MTNRSRHLALCALVSGSLAIWWRPIVADFRLAFSSEAHTYIALILPFSLALIYLERKNMPATFGTSAWLGATLMTIALLLRGAGAWNLWHLSSTDGLSVSMFGLVTWWVGSVILCLGLHNFKSVLFPLCFLLLVVPIPERVLSTITEFLQYESAFASSALFHLAQVPVRRDGVMLSIPGLDIEVARECSSIRSSMMLIVTTLILAHLFLRSLWRKTLLVVVAIPLSVVKNAVRIFTIAELGTRVDPGYLDGRLHRNGGIVFLSLAVAVIVVLMWCLRKTELLKPAARSAGLGRF